jgi:hypothetical protein
MGEVLGRDEDRLEQLVDVALLRERDADRVEVLELGEEMRLQRPRELRGRLRRGGERRDARLDLAQVT